MANAEAQLEAARAVAANGEIKAPFNGLVADLMVVEGQALGPGTELIVLSDPNRMLVQTTDLSERDIDKVKLGQAATIFIEPLEMSVKGSVSLVSPSATSIGGDVVYMVRLEFDDQPEGLLWGMSAEVEIVVEEQTLISDTLFRMDR